MSNWNFLGATLAAAFLISPISPVTAAPAKSKAVSAASPAPEGSWIPVARVDPTQPIQLNLINKTDQPLEYLMTTHTNARTLEAGKSVLLTSFQPPIFLNINFPDQAGTLKYQVSTEKNRITVEVVPIHQFGDHTLNIADTGAIYLY